jgi:protein-tyrosine phosphatase
MRIDFHAHILPNVDDGSESIEESLKLLEALKRDGVDAVVATPHLYLHRQSIENFLERRAEGVRRLSQATEGGDYPQIIVGAEIYFTTAPNALPLELLCIGNTDYLMIELPYNSFSRTFLNSFTDFINCCGHNIILAHIERYFDFNKTEYMNEIMSYDVINQVNCDSFESVKGRKLLTKLIKSGAVHLLGTDLHSIDRRPPTFGKAERYIRRKVSDNAFDNMMKTAENILFGQVT